jgi:hypothetical protein
MDIIFPFVDGSDDERGMGGLYGRGTYNPPSSFSTIKKQVRKKKISKKSKEQRIADKSISLAERVGKDESEKTI